MKRKIEYIIILSLIIAVFSACRGGYSFTGADIAASIKTIEINYFPNNASMVQPKLSNMLTESLKDKFLSQTNLELVNNNGDLKFEGMITNYNLSPLAFQANETAALNRLSISVNVKFFNKIEPNKNFDTNFTRYTDFESSQNFNAIEAELMQQIVNEIVVDIFNRAVANW